MNKALLPKMKTVMENEQLDVAGFESVTDEAGKHYCYNINTNTNYNTDAEIVVVNLRWSGLRNT